MLKPQDVDDLLGKVKWKGRGEIRDQGYFQTEGDFRGTSEKRLSNCATSPTSEKKNIES